MKDTIYSIRDCTYEDIPNHIDKIKKYWSDIDIENERKYSMKVCIDQYYTGKLVKDNDTVAFAYAYPISNYNSSVYGIALWFERKPYLAMLFDYIRNTTAIKKMYFTPHEAVRVPFKFLLSKTVIDNYLLFNKTPHIRINGEEAKKLHKQYYINYGVVCNG